MRMYSYIQYQRLQNLVWMFFQQLFMLTSTQPFPTQWQYCGQAWKFKHFVSISDRAGGGKYNLWDSVWNERLWGKSVEENVRTVAFTTGRSLRLLCVGIVIHSSERQASGTVLRLPARKFYWCRLQFSSACLVRMYCIITEDKKLMWVIPCPLQCTILHCALWNFCSYICTAKNTDRDLHQNEKCHYTKI